MGIEAAAEAVALIEVAVRARGKREEPGAVAVAVVKAVPGGASAATAEVGAEVGPAAVVVAEGGGAEGGAVGGGATRRREKRKSARDSRE